jgi:hypothetical protein
MNLREEILAEHSKRQASGIAAYCSTSQEHFDELITLFLEGDYRITQRASWSLSETAKLRPQFLKKHFTTLAGLLDQDDLHGAVKRNVLKIFSEVPFPKRLHGRILSKCFELVEEFKTPIAVKGYSLITLEKMTALYPEIIPELKVLVSERALQESAAFNARAKRIMKLKG